MKLLTFAESQRKVEPKKEEAKNVNWIISFAVAGVKGVIIEASSHTILEDTIYFYKAKEKIACAMFNMKDVLCVVQEGCAFVNKTTPNKKR